MKMQCSMEDTEVQLKRHFFLLCLVISGCFHYKLRELCEIKFILKPTLRDDRLLSDVISYVPSFLIFFL